MPDQTSTFLFCDLEGSTALLQESGTDVYQQVLQEVREILRRALADNGGTEVDTAGDGLFASFSSARGAVLAAVSAQRILQQRRWGTPLPVAVRMGVHTGESVSTGEGVVGLDVHRAARVCSAAHGGQILLSLTSRALVSDGLPDGISLLDLGEVCLKGVKRPEQIFQVVAPRLRKSFPPPNAERRRKTNIPERTQQLVGREKGVREILSLLRREEVHLLTLTGPGGTGKTSLALQVGSQAMEDFPDGVCFVSLVDISEPGLIPPAICRSLGMRPGGTQVMEAIRQHLGGKRFLLILDNAEQVQDAAEAVSGLIQACPGVTVLVTSRILLRLGMEREYRVPPLDLPYQVNIPTLDILMEYPATALFLERARSVHPEFTPDEEDATAVLEICRRLDGLPLAIELAAARVKLFSPSALLDRLKKQTDILRTSQSGIHERHATIRNTIDWSYNLLTDEEKDLFRTLSVFRGGCSVEQAEEIHGSDVIDDLTALIDKSLVRREEHDGEIRFTMLETIHDYASQKLNESGRAGTIARKHAEYFLKIAEMAEPHLTGPEQRQWLDLLAREHDNFREVFRWARNNDEGEIGLRLGAALWRFWVVRGFMIEGESRLRSVLTLTGAAAPTRYRAKTLNGLGTIVHESSSHANAKPVLEESLSIWRILDDRNGVATTLNSLGWIAMFEADHARCRDLSNEAMAIHREAGNKRGVAVSLNNIGWSAVNQSRLTEALTCFEKSMTLREELGDERGVAFLEVNAGWALVKAGRHEEALRRLERGIGVVTSLGDQQLRSWALSMIGNLWEDLGDYGRALPLLSESIAIMSEVGNIWTIIFEQCSLARVLHHHGESEKSEALLRLLQKELTGSRTLWIEGIVSYELGSVCFSQKKYDQSLASFRESLGLRQSVSDQLGVAQCLAGIASLAILKGEKNLAERLCRTAISICEEHGGHLPHWEQTIANEILVSSAEKTPSDVKELLKQIESLS